MWMYPYWNSIKQLKFFFFSFVFSQAVSYRSELISLKHYLPLTFILYFTCSSLIKAKPVSIVICKKKKNNKQTTKKHLGVTWHKVSVQLKLKRGLWSDVLRYRLDYVCMLGQPVSRCITKSAGFTYLTQTFLFCSCIPALHDCSGCGLKDYGCWQPGKKK